MPVRTGGVGLAGGRSFGLQREHRVPVESLVHFFCRCVEHLCGGGESDVPPGAGVANGFGAAGFSAGAPSALPRRCTSRASPLCIRVRVYVCASVSCAQARPVRPSGLPNDHFEVMMITMSLMKPITFQRRLWRLHAYWRPHGLEAVYGLAAACSRK